MARFRGFRQAGVNRLSLGIQSFNPAHLRALGRIHDEREAMAAAEAALGLFEEVNLDLMYALPGQSLEQARRDLETAIRLGPTHLSAYHLTLEPNTPFAARPPALPDDDLAADMQAMAEEALGAAGYQNYETSAFARAGHRCRHNLNYWTFGDYLGIGAGAHGKLSFQDRIERQARAKHPAAYMEALLSRGGEGAVADRRELTRADRVFEFMMNALRLNEGFDPRLFEARTGLSIVAAAPGLLQAERRGLIHRDPHNIRPSERGRRFLNELLQELPGRRVSPLRARHDGPPAGRSALPSAQAPSPAPRDVLPGAGLVLPLLAPVLPCLFVGGRGRRDTVDWLALEEFHAHLALTLLRDAFQ
jgi:putative oxygen-independent coproporphyrinogen III oxidase